MARTLNGNLRGRAARIDLNEEQHTRGEISQRVDADFVVINRHLAKEQIREMWNGYVHDEKLTFVQALERWANDLEPEEGAQFTISGGEVLELNQRTTDNDEIPF